MLLKKGLAFCGSRILLAVYTVLFSSFLQVVVAQQTMSFNDLSILKTTGKTWRAGADINQPYDLSPVAGTGIVANLPGNSAADLLASVEYDDVDTEREYLMAKGSDSGIYLQGRYAVQLADSGCTKNLTAAETGLGDQRLGDKLMLSEISTERMAIATTIKAIGSKEKGVMGRTKEKADTTHKPGTKVKRGPTKATHPKTVNAAKPTFSSIKPLLVKNTCISCHNETKQQVGPAFVEVAKRNYSVDEIVKLIHNPQPQHWPDYSTEMPPMPQVSVAEAKKIAAWIRSLGK